MAGVLVDTAAPVVVDRHQLLAVLAKMRSSSFAPVAAMSAESVAAIAVDSSIEYEHLRCWDNKNDCYSSIFGIYFVLVMFT